MQELDS